MITKSVPFENSPTSTHINLIGDTFTLVFGGYSITSI